MNHTFLQNCLLIAGLFLAFYITSSCNEPSLVGEDFVGDDVIDVQYADTFTVLARPVKFNEDLIVWDRLNNIRADHGLIGSIDDPNFGKADYSVYVQYRPSNPQFDNDNYIVDSVVLHARYDTLFFYGDPQSNANSIEVNRIIDLFDPIGVYNIEDDLMTDPAVLGNINSFNADPRKPYIFENTDGDTIIRDPQLRIFLNSELGEEILSLDSLELVFDSLFYNQFQGLHIKPSQVSNEVLGLEFTDNLNSGISIYYRVPDTSVSGFENRILELVTTDFKPVVQHIERDTMGSLQSILYNNATEQDSLVFAEGLDGAEFEVEFPEIDRLENVLILRADLEMYTATPNSLDYNVFAPTSLLRTRYKDGNEFVPTDEYNEAFASNGIPGLFGGFVELNDTTNTAKYTFNLSRTIQAMAKGSIPNKLRFNANPRLSNARRSIIYGSTGLKPMKLSITYTTNN